MERVSLLVSDLDGTLLGDDRALEAFVAWHDTVKDRVRLVYSSGRFMNSIRASIDDSPLPEPDAMIGGVGTEIFDQVANRQLVGWPPISNGWDPHSVRAACARRATLHEQPVDLSSRYKVSYYGYDLSDVFLDELRCELMEAGQDVTIVYSSNRDLDVLPAAVNKGAAAAYLAERWGIANEDVIVAGDSGNDLAMFLQGFRGIVVGNAQPELRELRGSNIYQATRSYAAGVIEGLQFWLDG